MKKRSIELSVKPILLAAGSIMSVFLASLCCTGPLILASLGLGSAGSFSVLEKFRPVFLLVAATLLGYSLWKAYRPVPTCCSQDSRKVRANKISLWLVSFLVLLFFVFPYLNRFQKTSSLAAGEAGKVVTLRVEGMTCTGCENTVEKAILKTPGVVAAKVSHDEKKAVIRGTEKLDAEKVIANINQTHYKAFLVKEDRLKKEK
ncbi:MAG: cation transporter [Armatimonadetes bacterium]|nr:cation transporter [Armatimonadota bacterium]